MNYQKLPLYLFIVISVIMIFVYSGYAFVKKSSNIYVIMSGLFSSIMTTIILGFLLKYITDNNSTIASLFAWLSVLLTLFGSISTMIYLYKN